MTEHETTHKPLPREMLPIGAFCILTALILLRSLTLHEPFPMWESDPYLFSIPLTGIPFGFGVLLNTAVMLLGLIVFLLSHSPTNRTESVLNVLAGIGFAGLGFHLFTDPQSLLNASTLGAMISTILATRIVLSSFPHWIQVFMPLVLGSVVLLGAIGAHQVYIQHPQTVEMYDQTKDAFLNARGWTDGSFEVMSYERRLRQPEPTGWFGLSNVYASFIAAFGVAMLMLTLCSIRKAWWILCGMLAIVIFAMLVISKSKGGIGAAVLGFVTLQYVLARPSSRPRRLGWSTLSACILVIFGVIGGAMMHQLSLLFRGQYMVGALRIFTDHPLIGVGPGHFQDAYMVNKPSTSPEDVTSAHNLVFDLLSQLGLAGLAFIAVLVLVLLSARIPARDTKIADPRIPIGIPTRIILLSVLVVGVGVIRLQSNAMDIELMSLLLVGIVCWIIMSLLLAIKGTTRTLSLAMTGAAVVLALHAMLDLTPVWIVSAPLFGLCIGMGFLPTNPPKTTAPNAKNALAFPKLFLALSLACSVVFAGLGAFKGIARDQRMIELGTPAQEISLIRTMIEDRAPGEEITQRITHLIGAENMRNQLSILQALDQFEVQTRYQSALGFMKLAEDHHDRTLDIAAVEQVMKSAMTLDTHGFAESAQLWNWVAASALTLSSRESFTELKWAGQAYMALAQFHSSDETQAIEMKELALDVWTLADPLNPHDPKHAYRLMELSVQLANRSGSAKWATEAIERSDRMRLDPLKQLDSESLQDARSVLMSAPD